MGRAKVPIKKIQNNYTRKVTFSKRRNGLIKKAYELSVLCDIEVALIMFSPTGQLSHFSNRRRIEDVLMRYLRHEEQEKTPAEIQKDRRDGIHNVIIPNKENLISVLENLKAQADVVTQGSSNNQASSTSNLSEISGDSTIKDLNEEVMKSHARYEELKDTLWLLYGDIQNLHETHEELDERETRLMEVLTRVRERKKYLMTNSSKLAASVPLPSMLPQNSTLLPTTQGLVQIMQPHQEGTSSQVQQKSILLQQTKASNEKIILQPPFEGYLGMKMEGSWSSENKVSEYQNQPSYFSNGVVPIPYEKADMENYPFH